MSQLNWTYVDDRGLIHRIGLFHGDRTGHLLLYCNKRIVLIDFHVLKSKKYSFFIDDELCQVNVERKNDKFLYGLEIDNQTRTPKNLAKKKLRALNGVYIILSLIGILAVIAAITAFMIKWNQ